MSFHVYILQSLSTNRYYIGQTENPNKRISEHNNELAGHTRKEQPWRLVEFKYLYESGSNGIRKENKKPAEPKDF
jgi:putative endonuclease